MVQRVVKSNKLLIKEDCKNHENILFPLRVVVKYTKRVLKNGQTLDVPMPKNIVAYEHNLIVNKEDILKLHSIVEVSATYISIYVKYVVFY